MAQESGSDVGNGFCSQCGEQLEQGANYCAHCGAATSALERPEPAVTGGADTSAPERPEPADADGADTSAPARPEPALMGNRKVIGHIKYRNMVMQVVLVIMTFGIYALYWFYVTLNELHKANGRSEGAGLWTILSLIPFVQYFAYWHQANEYTEFVDEKYPAHGIFILWVIFSPAVWFVVQSDLNRVAKREK